MIRLLYLSVFAPICVLACISNAMSAERNPAFQNSGSSYSRGSSNEINGFSPRTKNNFQQGTQRQGGETRSSHLVQRTKPVTKQGAQLNTVAARKKSVSSNPITPLDRQKQASQGNANQVGKRSAPSIWGTLGALLVVISIILVSAKLFKKHHPLASTNLPREVMEVLGKKPLDARQTIHFVRCGSRILILGSSPAGLEMLSEVQDPVEVDLITGMCRERAQSSRSNSTFLNLFQSAQAKTEQNVRNSAEDQFPHSVQTQPDQPVRKSEQEDFADYDSAVTRLQQKLMHSSRQSLNKDVESGHA